MHIERYCSMSNCFYSSFIVILKLINFARSTRMKPPKTLIVHAIVSYD